MEPSFLDIILMVFLSHIELLSHLDLCDNWLLKLASHLFHELLSLFELFLVRAPYPAAILLAQIGALAVHLGGVVHHEKSLQ